MSAGLVKGAALAALLAAGAAHAQVSTTGVPQPADGFAVRIAKAQPEVNSGSSVPAERGRPARFDF